MISSLSERSQSPIDPQIASRRIQQCFGKAVPYGKTLKAHFGCVNAIRVSASGKYLLSGGDDKRVLVWDLLEPTDRVWTPQKLSHTGHMSNIFSVSFDCHESKIFSCANDGLLLRYDRERSTASNVILAHDEACLKLSCHPENEHLVLTAGQDYAVKLWDMRSESLVGRIQYMGVGFNSVEFNPISSNYFISSDDSGGILLHDLRMAFHTKRPLLRYTTKLYHKSRQSRNVDIPSATWSSDGKHIGALLQRYRPVIYTVDDPDPLVVLDTDESKGQRYQSTITIKSGSFSDSFGSLSFFAGSEHKAAYGWHIPPISDLLEQRETSELKYSTDICFIREKDQVQIKPARLPQADIVLRDHDSIVNSISCHPTLPWIVTAGVEKVVRLFSSVPLYGSEESPASSPIELNGESLEPDSEVLRYFALLLQQEPGTSEHLFVRRRFGFPRMEFVLDADE